MSYNIRYDTPNDGENWWEKRKEAVVDLLETYHPEIFGIQEGKHHQVQYLDSSLIHYTYIGVARDDGKTKGEYSAIFYDATKYKVSRKKTFWLSDQSKKVSVGWDAAMERVCTYGLFKHKESGKKIWVFNTHYDHIGVQAREMSSKLILSRIKKVNKAGYPVILMGDLNSIPGSNPITTITNKLEDTFEVSTQEHEGPIGTFNGFDASRVLDNRIDYVFVKNISVISHIHINDKRTDGFFISDHLPVFISLQL
ncbi:MAG: endonuclease/exonuclease/phosphatase [Flavobacteriaceae bacterium]|nr:MAG: endonuclease/exonuclease/phosphatase [Flavobacteriaceae bacterium]